MGAKGEKPGVAAALSATGPGSPPSTGGQQLALDLHLNPPVGSKSAHTDGSENSGARGPGRPRGASNKRTLEWQEYLDARYPSSLEGLRAVGGMRPRDLLIELELWKPDPANPDAPPPQKLIMWAFERIQWSQKEATPYTHAKLGGFVQDDDGNDVPMIMVGTVVRPGGGAPGDSAKSVTVLEMRPADVVREEIQALSNGQDEPSNTEASNGDTKPLEDKGKNDA